MALRGLWPPGPRAPQPVQAGSPRLGLPAQSSFTVVPVCSCGFVFRFKAGPFNHPYLPREVNGFHRTWAVCVKILVFRPSTSTSEPSRETNRTRLRGVITTVGRPVSCGPSHTCSKVTFSSCSQG